MRTIRFEGNELELRAQLLRVVLSSTAIGASVWLVAGLAGAARSRLFPWDALCVLVAYELGAVLLRWRRYPLERRVAIAGAWFIAIATQPLIYAVQWYGIATPVPALLMLGLIIAGLLFGYWFTLFWTAMYCGWIVLLAVGEVNGWWTPPGAIRSVPESVSGGLFWWALLIATGWLTRLFSNNLERVLAVSRGQTTALAATLSTLTTEADPTTALDQVFKTTADQLGARWASLFLIEDGVLHMRRAYGNGAIVRGAVLGQIALPPFRADQSALWQEVARTRRPLVVNDISNDPRILHRALHAGAKGYLLKVHAARRVAGHDPGSACGTNAHPARRRRQACRARSGSITVEQARTGRAALDRGGPQQ